MATLAALDPENQVNFTYLRDFLGLTDGNLGAHLMKLEEAGYVDIEKTFVERKPQTFIGISNTGRKAFQDHVAVLCSILEINKEDKWNQ